MEQNQTTELFSLQIDPVTKAYLSETARWARFLSIVGFILCILILLSGFLFGSVFSYFTSNSAYETAGFNPTGLGVTMVIVYILLAVLYFFPCLFLFRFATKMKTALNGNAQEELNLSFQNLKSLFKYVGIITIIVLAMYALVFTIGILGLATR